MPEFERYEVEGETEGDLRVRHLGERVRLGGGPGFLAKSAAAGVVPAYRTLVAADIPALDNTNLANRTRWIWIPADNSWTITTGTPALAIRGSTANYYEKMPAWAFDKAAVEGIATTFYMPADWNSGAITMSVYWAGDGAGGPSSNEVLWQAVTAGVASTQQIDQTFENGPTVLGTVTTYEALVISAFAAITPDAPFNRINLARIATDGTDDYDGDAWFCGLLISYTADM